MSPPSFKNPSSFDEGFFVLNGFYTHRKVAKDAEFFFQIFTVSSFPQKQ